MSEAALAAPEQLLFENEPERRQRRKAHFRRLGAGGQPVFKGIAALAAARDLESLERLRDGKAPSFDNLNRFGEHKVIKALGQPFKEGESALAHALRALACIGLTLARDQVIDAELRVVVRWYKAASLSVRCSSAQLSKLADDRRATRAGAVLARLAEIATESDNAGPAMAVAVIAVAMSEPDEFRPRPSSRWRADPNPQIGVLFAGGAGGLRARLRARVISDLPNCLVPDPLTMTMFSGDERFQQSLAVAWAQAKGTEIGGAVLWSITTGDGPIRRVTDESLGGALTTVFNELRRNRHRVMALLLAELDETAIVGRVIGSGLRSVGGYHDKLKAAGLAGRVIVPLEDEQEARTHAGDGIQIVPASRWKEAARKARRAGRTTWAYRFGATALSSGLAVALVTILLAIFAVDEAQTHRVAARVAAQASNLGSSDPSLAALLALAAYRMDDSPETVAAMMRVSQDAGFITRKINAHPGGVRALAQASGSSTLYSAGEDGAVAAWDMRSGKRLAWRRYPDAVINRLVVHSSVPLMLTADLHGGVQLWRTADGGPLTGPDVLAPGAPTVAPDDETVGIAGLGFLGLGGRAYAVTRGGQITTWDTVTQSQITQTSIDDFAGVPASSRSRTVVAVEEDAAVPGTVTAVTGLGEIFSLNLDRRRGVLIGTSSRLADGVTAVAARPDDGGADTRSDDGKVFAVGTRKGAFLWNTRTNTEIPSSMGVNAPVTDLRFGGFGHALAIGTERGVVVARETGEGADARFSVSGAFQGGPTDVLASGTEPDGLMAAGHDSGLISIMDLSNRRIAAPPADASTIMAFDTDGRMLVTDHLNNVRASGLRILKPSAGAKDADRASRLEPSYPEVLKLQPDPMWWNSGGLFFSNDAVLTPKLAVVGGQEPDGHGVVLVWDARTGRPLQRLPFPGGYPDLVNNVRLVPEMSALVARSMNGAIRVWSTQTWQILFERTIGQGGGMEVRPGTTTVVLPVLTSRSGAPIREQGALAFVDLKKRTVRVQPVPGSLYRASYTPDGEILATISSDNRLRLLDGDGKRRADSPEISLPTKPNDVVVDGSGERAAVTLENGQTLIYDISSATLAMPPLVDVDGYEGVNVAWDPRSDLLAIGSMDDSDSQKQGGRVNFWKTGRLTWTTQLCGLAGRDITKAEWERYIPEEDPQSLCSSSS